MEVLTFAETDMGLVWASLGLDEKTCICLYDKKLVEMLSHIQLLNDCVNLIELPLYHPCFSKVQSIVS